MSIALDQQVIGVWSPQYIIPTARIISCFLALLLHPQTVRLIHVTIEEVNFGIVTQSMSLLFKHLRIHQVFGANTDVGKTLLTSALVRASAALGNDVYYLKPVSTGPMSDADDELSIPLVLRSSQYWKIEVDMSNVSPEKRLGAKSGPNVCFVSRNL